MNYFEYHLGDYAKDAGHLTMIRDGAYLRLMAVYYSREKPLPLDLSKCYDLTRCASRAEKQAVEYVLTNFFTRTEEGYRQKRCDEELERYRAKSEAAKASANARWSHNGRNANGSTNGMRSHSDGNALQSPVSSLQSPVTKEDTPPTPLEGGRVRGERKRRDEPDSGWRPPTEEQIRAGE